ncbi:MAG: GAF domain-containing protein [Armatimonadetes bacterium]|nr:GAF domain-containing protein [Armatimonadota bacterium]
MGIGHQQEPGGHANRDSVHTSRDSARTEALIHVAARLNSRMDPSETLDAICQETARALDVPFVILRLYDPRRDHFHCVSQYGIPPEDLASFPPVPRSLCNRGFQEGSPFDTTRDLQSHPHLPAAALYRRLGLRSALSVKIEHGGEWIGLLSIATDSSERSFTREDYALLKGLSDLAAESIGNARLHRDARRRYERLQALRRIDTTMLGNLDLPETLSVILEQVTQHLEIDAADILLYHPGSQMLEYAAGRGFQTPDIARSRFRLGEGHAGEAGEYLEMKRVDFLQEPHAAFVRSDLIREEGFAAYIAAPLVSKGRLKGVLEIFHRSPLDPDAEWLHFLEMLSGQAALAVENSTLFDDLQLTNIELTLAYDITLEGWVRALDLRDKETEGHTQRVTTMTMELAAAFKMTDEELIHIRRGALLHDIGKIGIPDQILLKPGPLDDEERALMNLHTQYAYDLLSPIPYLHPALDIPYCHHERWDGTGYPRGLKGHEIPLAARIFAVVDVWDSLRSNRPYRSAWAEEKTLEYLRAMAGTHFDPTVVNEFLKLLEQREQRTMTNAIAAKRHRR